jgi:hypothetical protein
MLKFAYIYYMLRLKTGDRQAMHDLWWTKWHWGGFSPNALISPANFHSTNGSVFINHPVIDAIWSR